jgi:outer membrane protein assembly factor BamB
MISAQPPAWFKILPWSLGLAGAVVLVLWCLQRPLDLLTLRVPGSDDQPEGVTDVGGNPVLRGTTTQGPGTTSPLPGDWLQFRGTDRTGFASASGPLADEWPPSGPRRLWQVAVGEGYAGPVVEQGRVYVMDYDRENQQDALRCLSLENGTEIWRFSYPVSVKRNHGMSRTVPALSSNRVVALGPKCHVVCADATSGELLWGIDLVGEHGAKVPPWYAGQCPLIDDGRVILAPGGPNALLIAVSLESGEVLWKTPNPQGWKMTHSSVMPMQLDDQSTFVYCGSGGVVGVSAADGRILWETTEWKISIATVPSPVPLPDGRVFLCGGYNAGSLMMQIQSTEEGFQAVTEYRLKASEFGATQHTPILYNGHLYGIHPDGPLVCLSLDGQTLWSSEETSFGLGPLLIADNKVFALDDSGKLTMAEATPEAYRPLAQSDILHGHEAWAPMALAGSRLLLRDMEELACLELAGSE